MIFSLLALYAFFFFRFRKYHDMLIRYSPAPSAFFFFYFCKYYGTFVSFSFQFIALRAL